MKINMTKIESLKQQIATCDDQLSQLHARMQPIEQERDRVWKLRLELLEKIEEAELELLSDEGAKITFFLKEDGGPGSMAVYREATKYFKDLGFWPSGYFPATEQKNIEIMLPSDGSKNELTLNSLRLILPYVKPHPECNGAKRFGIFEHTCSEYGVYHFEVFEDEKCTVTRTTYGRQQTEAEFDSLAEGLAYIQKNHWYD